MGLQLNDGTVIPDSERTPCEVWCRAMGYFRPVADFNIGKQAEFKERTWFKVPEVAR